MVSTDFDRDQSAEKVQRRFRDLGYTTVERPSWLFNVTLDATIDYDGGPPYLLMPEKLHAQAQALTQGMDLQSELKKPQLTEGSHAEKKVFNHLVTGRVLAPEEMFTLSSRGNTPRTYSYLAPLKACWSAIETSAAHIKTALANDAQRPETLRLPEERRLALEISARRIDICADFAVPFFNAENVLPPNPTFHKIALKHGLPAALLIAYHHRATCESPLWRFMFPDVGELPAEYSQLFHEYQATARTYAYAPDEAAGSVSPGTQSRDDHIAATPMQRIADKIDQDLHLCTKLLDLTHLEIEHARIQLSTLHAEHVSAADVEQFAEVSGHLDQLQHRAASLKQYRTALQAAQASTHIQSRLDEQGYSENLLKDLLPDDLMQSILKQPSSDVRGLMVDVSIKLQAHIQTSERNIALLQDRLKSPELTEQEKSQIQGEITELVDQLAGPQQQMEAVRFAADLSSCSDVLMAHDPDRAVELTHTAWVIARQAGMSGGAASDHFNAVLPWLRVAEEDRFGEVAQTRDPNDAATQWMASLPESAEAACTAIGAYVGSLERQLTEAAYAPHHAELEARITQLQELVTNIQTSIGPQPRA